MTARDAREVFPPSPINVPTDLTAPSGAYRRHAWLAAFGLLSFVAVYLGFIGYFGKVTYNLFLHPLISGDKSWIGGFFLSIPAMFFLAFLLRGLFVVKHAKDPSLVEIKPETQPKLFAFLHRLADETRAPRPKHVYVSGRVNASVFYDFSFWNLIFPSQKNLELGLGLVNVLTLDELKAVIAHEYGHFAQRSMAIGRWVYMSQQIAGHIVASRSGFDTFLQGLSNMDIRIGWIGWLMRLFVWAIRAVLDTVFRLVVLAHRALGREMEFQADRVAVSVSGSDSLVHALHRLGPADEAWEEAVNFTATELINGRPVTDLFELQTSAMTHLQRILADPTFGVTPDHSLVATHRVFDEKLAQPPRMWLTHPPNREREDSAKALYVQSALDARSAWVLFDGVEALRTSVTTQLFAKIEKRAEPVTDAPPVHVRFEKRFSRPSLNPSYRGVYLGRSIAAFTELPKQMIDTNQPADAQAVVHALDRLYPEDLRQTLSGYRARREEEAMLQGLAKGVLTAPGGAIRYRGRTIRRKELPGVVESVKTERKGMEGVLLAHDRRVRAAHVAAARHVGEGWPEHLEGLVALLHFTTHAGRRLNDAHTFLHHELSIVLADGTVSSSERTRVLMAALDLHSEMRQLWSGIRSVRLPPGVDEAFERMGGWEALSEQLGLSEPTNEHLGDWLKVVDGWVKNAMGDLSTVEDLALDALLSGEAKVAAAMRSGEQLEAIHSPAIVPSNYKTCCVGEERKRQEKLGLWDRFQTADGFFPGAARAAVASGLLFPVLFAGGHIGEANVHIVNGLYETVTVTIGERSTTVAPAANTKLSVDPAGDNTVTATTRDGRVIETFKGDLGGGFSTTVYNVAQAAPLSTWTARYGTRGQTYLRDDRPLGAPRWMFPSQDVLFTAPPTSISTNGGGGTRSVLEAQLTLSAADQLDMVKAPKEREAMLRAHLAFDRLDSPNYPYWYAGADSLKEPDRLEMIIDRQDHEKRRNVMLERIIVDSLEGDAHTERCSTLQAEGDANPEDVDAIYLSLRCEPMEQSNKDLFEAWEAHPEHPWLSWSVAEQLSSDNRWEEALEAWRVIYASPSTISLRAYAGAQGVRVARLAGVAGKTLSASWARRTSSTDMLASLNQIEGPQQKEDSDGTIAWRALAKGDVTVALNKAKATKDAGFISMMELVVGASDNATPAQLQRAVAIDPKNGEFESWVHLIALIRAGERYADELEAMPWSEPIKAQLLARKPEPQLLLRLLRGMQLEMRLRILAVAAFAWGPKAPLEWRSQVKAGLFGFERPYLK